MSDQTQDQDIVEVEETVAPEAVSEENLETAVAEEVEASEEVAAEPEYTPDYKFKAYDKEYEFDEELRGAIKSKEQEDKLREIYCKAYALDDMKEKYTKVQEYKDKYGTLEKNVNTLGTHLEQDNLGAFFDALKIPEQKVMKYVLDKINYQEMSLEEKQQHDAQLQHKQQAFQYQNQLTETQTQLQKQQERMVEMELNYTMNEPEIQEVAKIYDERVGTPGAFQNEILQRGDTIYSQTGQIESPRKMAHEIADGLRKLLGPLGSPPAPQAAPQQIQPQSEKPTIPNIRSKGSSPAKSKIKSLDDLESMVKERYGV